MGTKLSIHSSEKKEAVECSSQSNVIKMGSLDTNEVVLKGKSIEPIHCLLYFDGNHWTLENISGRSDLSYNKKSISSSIQVKEKGEVRVAGVLIVLEVLEEPSGMKRAPEKEDKISSSYSGKERRRRPDLLFAPRRGSSTGSVLEVISYWDDRVLGMEHFGETKEESTGTILIGSSEKAHFSVSNVKKGQRAYPLCHYTKDSFTLNLTEGMTARVRKDGVYTSIGPGKHKLSRGDVAHVHYFSTRFFFVHKTLPAVHVPKETIEDPIFAGLLALFLISYTFLCSSFYLVGVPEKEDHNETIWAQVEERVPEIPAEKVDLNKVKREKVVSKEKPAEKKIEEKKKTEPKKEKPKKDPYKEMKKLNKSLVASKKKVEAKKKVNPAGKRKGSDKKNTRGVEDAKTKESSGLNLSVVGLGLGDVKSHGGLGAIPVKLQKEAGGAGRGAGSAKKTFGLGGVGEDLSKADLLALNTDGAHFGDASESLTGGNLDSQFGREGGGAELQIHASDPLIGAGIDKKAVWDVLMSAGRAINHCYNTLLQRDRTAEGTVVLSIVVKGTGKAPNSKVEKSDIKDPVMQECVLNVIRRLTFPKPEGVDEVEFKMPYGFSPE